MKSIKEKAEAYDKVLEWATEAHKVCDCMLKEDLEHLFPELKESEDERIRKALLEMVHDTTGDSLWVDYNVHKEDAIAWLEKQGEHANFLSKIQIGDKVTRNKDGVLVNLSQLNRVAKNQGEQKPADTEKGANGNEREIPIPEPPLTIKHAKEVMGIKQNDAWSEEDEKCIENAIMYCKWARDIAPNLYCYEISEKSINWLKSLKERYTWKPSDEQMETLENVRKILHADKDIYSKANNLMYNFEELIRTLKKLREK